MNRHVPGRPKLQFIGRFGTEGPGRALPGPGLHRQVLQRYSVNSDRVCLNYIYIHVNVEHLYVNVEHLS